jgi:polyhydroxybutyrate depolymerase
MKIHPVKAVVLTGAVLVFGCSGASDAASGAAGSAGSLGSLGGLSNAGGVGSTAGGASSFDSGGAGSGNVAGLSSGGASSGSGGGGAAGVGGSMASAGSGGTSTGGVSHASGNSTGCNKANADSVTAWTTHSIEVTVAAAYAADFSTRTYFTRPPKNYDPSKAYPLTVWGNGCGQTVAEPTQLSGGPAADDSIMVEMLANPKNHDCYSAGPDGDHADSPEIPYFDAVLAEAEASFCVDKSKVYVGGWSSGGWFTTLMACTHADVIKGVGWASAGLQLNHPACVGPMPAILERGVDDTGTPLAQTDAAREDLRMRNGCSTETEPWDPGETAFDTSTCVSYKGCMAGYPLVWCPIPGGHNNGGKLSQFGFWKFWSALP